MKPFRDWSIRHKLTSLFVAMACITTVTVSLSMGVFDLSELRQSMVQDLSTLANVLGQNSTAALTFQDADAARRVLQALQAKPNVTAACIYGEAGEPFATYVRGGKHQRFVPPPVQSNRTYFESGRLVLFRRIVFAGETIGTIYIESDLQPLDARLREYSIAMLATALIALLLAFLLSPRLQRPISQPLAELVKTVEDISNASDYSLRARLTSRDEFGTLVAAFNGMLEQIEKRDGQLRQHREHLEDQVASRTAELLAANERSKLQAEALNAASNSIVIADLDGAIVWTNPAFSTLSGYSSAEVLGKNPRLLSSGRQDKRFYTQMWATITSGATWRGELVNRRKNASFYHEEMTITPVSTESGRIAHFVAIKQDITDRKRAEEALRRSEEQYRLLFDNNPIPMWVFDRTSLRFLAVNAAAIRQYGFTEPEFLSMRIADLYIAEETSNLLHEVGDGGKELEASRHCKKNGTVIDVQIVCNSLNFHGADAMLVAAYDITEQKHSKELLQESENKYRVLFEDSADAFWLMDQNGFVSCNSAALKLFGYSSSDEFKRPADISPRRQLDGRSSQIAADERIAAAFLKGKERFEWLHQRKNGESFLGEVCLSAMTLNGHQMLLASVHDITARKEAEEALLFKTALLEAQSETTIDGILVVNESDEVVLVNKQFGVHFEVPHELLCSHNDQNLRIHVAGQVEDSEGFIERVRYIYSQPDYKSRDEFRLKNGKTIDRYSAPFVDAKGQRRGRIWYFRDISERKVAEERVQFLAYYDALTELPNRILLHDRITKALAGARRRKEKLAVLFLDLDRFKIINDTLGHSAGDALLQEVASRLKGWARAQDTVARVGGDEFVLLLTSVQKVSDAAIAAQRVVDLIAKDFSIHGRALNVTCSVGVCMSPDHGVEAETLIKNADAAMYCAKQRGLNNVHFFTDELSVQMMERLTLERDLRLALGRKELYLVYQPQLEIATGQIIGFEALIRWQHPQLGRVLPDKFIRIAEDCGLIQSIGEWALRTACAQAREWQDEGLPHVQIAVNVSAIQFRQDGFRELIQGVLAETGLAAQYLVLELTESLLLTNADVVFSVLLELKKMGLKLAIDDFGTGYSSLSYLTQFPVSKLKIDRSFIRNVATNPDDAAITTAIIGMARSLNLKVIAEGVDDEAQMDFLRAHHCDEIQGYYFSKPLLVEDIADIWTKDQRLIHS